MRLAAERREVSSILTDPALARQVHLRPNLAQESVTRVIGPLPIASGDVGYSVGL